MKSFKLKLEGPFGCGKDTFMDLVSNRLGGEYDITKVSIHECRLGVEHEWKIELKQDIYSLISESTGVPRRDVKKVIHALTYNLSGS